MSKGLRGLVRTTKDAMRGVLKRIYAVFPQAQVLRQSLRRSKARSIEISAEFFEKALMEFREENWAAGRHSLACALASARRDNVLYCQFGAIFNFVPALLKDEAALNLLFRERSRALGLASLIETWWLWKTGQYDQVVDRAEGLYRALPDIESAKLLMLHKVSWEGTLHDNAQLVRDLAGATALPHQQDWKVRMCVQELGDPELIYEYFKRSRWARTPKHKRVPRHRVLRKASFLVQAGRLGQAKALVKPSNLGRDCEAAAFHIEYAMNARLRRFADTGHFRPKYYQSLLDRTADPSHPNLDALRDRLLAMRAKAPYALPEVAAFCPIHRSADLPSILAQVQSQTGVQGTAYFVFNNYDGELDEAHLHANWAGALKLKIFDLGRINGIGAVIQKSLPLVEEEFFLKLDADCGYGPNYIADMVAQTMIEGADLTIKMCKFRFYEGSNLLGIYNPDLAFKWTSDSSAAGGSAFCAKTDFWRSYAKIEKTLTGEDTGFVKYAAFHNARIYGADPFNHVSIHHEDKDRHTFRVPTLARGQIFDSRILAYGAEKLPEICYV